MNENAAEYLRGNEEQVMIQVKVSTDIENVHFRMCKKLYLRRNWREIEPAQ